MSVRSTVSSSTCTTSDPHDRVVSAARDEAIRQRLLELGGESEVRSKLNVIVPWLLSFGLHAIGVVIALLVTWAVVVIRSTPEATLIVADFRQPTLASVTPIEPIETQRPGHDDTLLQLSTPEPPTRTPLHASAPIAPPAAPVAPMVTDVPAESVQFVGLRASNARRIVYVVDASGSMVGTLPIILDELTRSIRSLTPSQSFAVIFFQRNQAVAAPPRNRLTPAVPDERERIISWMRSQVVPRGRSNPLRAIEAALRLRPDVIFLLGHEVTGSGQYEIDQDALLDELDRLNPRHRATGTRAVSIKCVQFLDPDPLETLRKIAELHGGPDGYRYLDRAELGVAPR